MIKRSLYILVAAVSAAVLFAVFQARTGGFQLWPGRGDDPMSASIRELTAAPARIIWCRDCSTRDDIYALEHRLELMGLDTEDGLGARVIVPGPRNISRPVISSDGQYVFFSDKGDGWVYRADWSGAHLARFAKGRALDTWPDPETGAQWVLIGDAQSEHIRLHFTVSRYRVDDPSIHEMVNDTFIVNENNFQLSGNGRYASADVDERGMGVIDLERKTFDEKGGGCWPSIAPDDSGLSWRMSTGHRTLILEGRGGERKVDINRAPGVDGYEVFHPRWSNRARFMVMSGPYKEGMGFNRLGHGGPAVDIYIGRFNEDFTAIERWARVTTNACADFYPDAWIAP